MLGESALVGQAQRLAEARAQMNHLMKMKPQDQLTHVFQLL
jgi:hypothetical protein